MGVPLIGRSLVLSILKENYSLNIQNMRKIYLLGFRI